MLRGLSQPIVEQPSSGPGDAAISKGTPLQSREGTSNQPTSDARAGSNVSTPTQSSPYLHPEAGTPLVSWTLRVGNFALPLHGDPLQPSRDWRFPRPFFFFCQSAWLGGLSNTTAGTGLECLWQIPPMRQRIRPRPMTKAWGKLLTDVRRDGWLFCK